MVKVLWAEAGAGIQFVPEIDRRFPESAEGGGRGDGILPNAVVQLVFPGVLTRVTSPVP